jgi:hypothetical protein
MAEAIDRLRSLTVRSANILACQGVVCLGLAGGQLAYWLDRPPGIGRMMALFGLALVGVGSIVFGFTWRAGALRRIREIDALL